MATSHNPAIQAKTAQSGQTTDSVQDLADQTRHTAKSTVDNASKAVASQANAAKGSVADDISDVASALRKAAEDMRGGSAQERVFGQIAGGLADASDALRDKDFGTIMHDVTRLARNNPLGFLSGAALAGFAVTRFLKASGEHEEAATEASADPYTTQRPTQEYKG